MSKLLTWTSDWAANSFIQPDIVFTLAVFCLGGRGIMRYRFLGALNICHVKKYADMRVVISASPLTTICAAALISSMEMAGNIHRQRIKHYRISMWVHSHVALLMNKSKAVMCAHISSQPDFNQRNCLWTLTSSGANEEVNEPSVLCRRFFIHIREESIKSQQAVVFWARAVTGVTN